MSKFNTNCTLCQAVTDNVDSPIFQANLNRKQAAARRADANPQNKAQMKALGLADVEYSELFASR